MDNDTPCDMCEAASVPNMCLSVHHRPQFQGLVAALTEAFVPNADPVTIRSFGEDAEVIIGDMLHSLGEWTELDPLAIWEFWDPEWIIEKRPETPRGDWTRFAVNGAEYAAPLAAEGFNAAEPWTTRLAVEAAFDV